MARVKNLTAEPLFVRVGKQGFTLAPTGDPDKKDERDVEDCLVEKHPRDGRAPIRDLENEGKLAVLGGSFSSDLASRVTAREVANLPGLSIDEIIEFDGASPISTALAALPIGAIILSHQIMILEDVVAGGTSVKLGLGEAGVDPDLYGLSADLIAGSGIDVLVWPGAALAGALALDLNACAAAGALGDTAPTAGKVRVKVSWLELTPLPVS